MKKPFIVKLVVKCIVKNKEGNILLVKESEKSSWKPGRWSLPGGKIDPGEDFLQAIHREMREETGVTVTVEGLFRIEELVEEFSTDFRLVHHYIFVVTIKEGQLTPADSTSVLQFFSKDDLQKLTPNDYTEYYYKDLLTNYEKSPKLYPVHILKVRNMNTDKEFVDWLQK